MTASTTTRSSRCWAPAAWARCVGQSGATRYVVFELLQGATLRERLQPGALPLRKAIDYARQIADALAAAHAKNITHRDIKPDNVFVTDDGRVKLLDFGLARSPVPEGAVSGASAATAAPITDAGSVLGTVGYMAPEQVRGQAVDHRADIFALGATLFEMCTGRRAFKGETPADTMSAVLTSDVPELALSGHHAPPALERIVRRCLEKQPGERFQSARDLSFALDALTTLSGSAAVPSREPPLAPYRLLPAAIAALAIVALGAAAVRYASPGARSSAPQDVPALRAEFPASFATNVGVMLELSPDGRRLAYTDLEPGGTVRRLFVRELATGATTRVEGSEGGVVGGWSPQSDALLFAARDRELRRFQVADRTTSVVATLPAPFRGVAWLDDDSIVAGMVGSEPLRRLVQTDGTWAPIVRGDMALTRPRRIGGRSDYVLALQSLQGRGEVSERRLVSVRLADGTTTPITDAIAGVAVAPGHLLLTRPGGLFALPFDGERLEIAGDAVRVAEEVLWDPPNGLSSVAASDAGMLAFRPSGNRPLQFQWIDASGRSLGLVGPPDLYGAFSLSPDGSRIVARLQPTQQHPQGALRFIDIARGVVSPIVTAPGLVSDPIWTPDGSRIVYRLGETLVRQSPFSIESERMRNETWFPDGISGDGRWLLAGRPEAAGGFGLFALAGDGSGDPLPLDSGSVSDEASFSPDGRLVSFHSTRTGRAEVYLSPFPPNGERWQVSPSGGVQPRWSSDGRSLYYIDLGAMLQRVPVTAGSPERTGRPEPVVNLGLGSPSVTLEQYAVHGDRILVMRQATDAVRETVVVVSNWSTLLPKRPALP